MDNFYIKSGILIPDLDTEIFSDVMVLSVELAKIARLIPFEMLAVRLYFPMATV
jgi:hypothetical protein